MARPLAAQLVIFSRFKSFGPSIAPVIPVTMTSTADVRRFWEAWIDGEVPGWSPEDLGTVAPDPHAADGRTFVNSLGLLASGLPVEQVEAIVRGNVLRVLEASLPAK